MSEKNYYASIEKGLIQKITEERYERAVCTLNSKGTRYIDSIDDKNNHVLFIAADIENSKNFNIDDNKIVESSMCF